MKIIAIGDLHGSDLWKSIVKIPADKYVFIGDYWDSFDKTFEQQLNNFNDLMEFKSRNPDQTVCLIGNHDHGYTTSSLLLGGKHSGIQNKHRFEIMHLMQTYDDNLQVAWAHKNFLFTHAGVSKTFLESKNIKVEDSAEEIAKALNKLYLSSGAHFMFNGYEPTGDEPRQGPLWIRPNSLIEWAPKHIKQVVGHTGVDRITNILNWIYFIDCIYSSGEHLELDI